MTDRNESLIALADCCEKAAGTDRVLDRAIFDAVTGGVFGPDNARFWHSTSASSRAANPFTTSLDAAMTLYLRVPARVPSDPRLAAAEALRQRADHE